MKQTLSHIFTALNCLLKFWKIGNEFALFIRHTSVQVLKGEYSGCNSRSFVHQPKLETLLCMPSAFCASKKRCYF